MIYIGKIVVPAGEGQNNLHTAEPFTIENIVNTVFLVPDTSGLLFETPTEDSQTTADTSAPMGTEGGLLQVFVGGESAVIAVWNPTAGEATVKVFRMANA